MGWLGRVVRVLLALAAVFVIADPVLRGAALGAVGAVGPALAVDMITAGAGYNIIFILTDQERYFELYPQGTDYRARERLKNIGTSFEKHYICSAMSTSSRSVIYTGRHITDTKMFENTNFSYQESLSPELTTVGHMMREAGYYTAYKGKVHLIQDADIERLDSSLDSYGFSDWDGESMGSPLEGHESDPAIAEQAIEWLRTKGASTSSSGRPFFLAVNLVNPHDIMYFNTDALGVREQDTGELLLQINRPPGTELYKRTYPASAVPVTWSQDMSSQVGAHGEYGAVWSTVVGKVPARQANWERFRDYYYNTIQDSDNQMLRILDEVERLGLMKNTIIVFTSDHGELQGSHSLNGKGNAVYENNIHVPMIIYHPDVQGGKKVTALTSHLDITPTILSAAENGPNSSHKNLKGHSMLPLMDGLVPSVRQDALFACSLLTMVDSTIPYGQPHTAPMMESERRGLVRGLVTAEGYKFARYFKPSGHNTPGTLEELFANNDVEIFDPQNDPEERHNLAETLKKQDPALVMSLNDRLNDVIAREIGTDNGAEFSRLPPAVHTPGGGCSVGWPYFVLLLGAAAIRLRK